MLFCLCGAAVASGVSIDASNFPDENFRAYISDNFDSDGDGVLSDEEIAGAEVIYLWSGGVIISEGHRIPYGVEGAYLRMESACRT